MLGISYHPHTFWKEKPSPLFSEVRLLSRSRLSCLCDSNRCLLIPSVAFQFRYFTCPRFTYFTLLSFWCSLRSNSQKWTGVCFKFENLMGVCHIPDFDGVFSALFLEIAGSEHSISVCSVFVSLLLIVQIIT
ncbi:hypothetical protein L2E82_40492 [Cichorium intybus]|uniref:Uncharacterized protein n=1 Tax=Cichorium intybus TaxID=13427 RepID=A0ACB9AMV2_CICIN|nr:hypothetical protein L2E82_40492 [Cichorium intybus]